MKIVLDEIAAAPATADLSELDAATAWVRARIVMRGNDKGPVREIRPAGFEEAVREMKELRCLLVSRDFADATGAAQRARAFLP